MTKYNWIFLVLIASLPWLVCALFVIIKIIYGEWMLSISSESLLAAGVWPMCTALAYVITIEKE